ncbi:tRNA glutamyl-Q(34) synthetase GluQRS [Lysobacter pythonis]|uniref:Glutamyl-Q tRNA(Asp) synthetase n=1 Tax=Solilutibacter pythonis TaxID=2483112 RepID=A0A3M2I3K2_9GAMM|nr:tRNA glutamyl-Q(34) synthetase GluQRS [Lysobacter pythonis]RMH93057.1 tRNA glutamyl-Q(34) synthetase GluQRS [Lysobacter pythonis]
MAERKRQATSVRGRFAPSPTGPLHLGSLLAALGSWLHARAQNGEWRVRIEDIDHAREVPGAVEAQLETLRRCGLEWDGEVVRQSQRDARYQATLDRLLTRGLAFECHCSRADLDGGGPHRRCLAVTKRQTPAIRLRVPDDSHVAHTDGIHGRRTQTLDREVGDFVLKRADGYWAYQLAVVVDDAAMDISEVVRGADLLDSTPRQIFLQRTLGLPTPHYAHLPLLLDDNGRKLGKSLAALPVDTGDPLPALRFVWQALGQSTAIVSSATSPQRFLRLALADFEVSRIPRAPVAPHNMI